MLVTGFITFPTPWFPSWPPYPSPCPISSSKDFLLSPLHILTPHAPSPASLSSPALTSQAPFIRLKRAQGLCKEQRVQFNMTTLVMDTLGHLNCS